jgi:uncharacterized protein YjbI with pentapeptide repeats
MKKIAVICLVVSLALVSCGTTAPTPVSNPMTEQAILQTMVATVQTGAAPVNPGETPTLNPGETPQPVAATPDPAHLAKLMEGIDSWNAWRTQNPDIRPELTRANLEGFDLARFDLSQARLVRANLSKAKLMGANLRVANLTNAKLTDANLKNAKLINARLSGADLTGADLTGAVLKGAMYDSTTIWPAGFDPVAAGAELSQ